MGVALIAVGLAGVSMRATASLITLPVTGGPGLDQGEICLTKAEVLCPGNASLTLTTGAPVVGSFVYDDVANTVSFSLQLVPPALFTGIPPTATLLNGSLYTATGIPVTKTNLSGGKYELSQSGAATGSAAPIWGAPYSQTSAVPTVSSLTCLVNSTGSGTCGVSLGPGGNLITDGVTPYQVFETFNVNVPEPATLAIVGAGLAGLLLATRRVA